MELKREEVRQLRFPCVWILLLNDMLEWRRGLSLFGAGLHNLLINAWGKERWCHQKVPGVWLQREQCKGGHDLCSPSNMSSPWRSFANPTNPAIFLASHCQDPQCLCVPSPYQTPPPLSIQYHIPFRHPPFHSWTHRDSFILCLLFHLSLDSLLPIPKLSLLPQENLLRLVHIEYSVKGKRDLLKPGRVRTSCQC